MTTEDPKLSDLITSLTEVWLLWMDYNTKSHDRTYNYEERRRAGEMCENLIKQEYEIVEAIDSFFDGKIENRNQDKTTND